MNKRQILVFCALLLVSVSCRDGKESSTSIVAANFTVALVQNQREALLQLTTPTARERLDVWLDSHSRFKCGAPFWEIDSVKIEVYPVEPAISKQPTDFSTLYLCRDSPTEVYMMTIKDIKLVAIDQRWLVDYWGAVCEANDLTSCIE